MHLVFLIVTSKGQKESGDMGVNGLFYPIYAKYFKIDSILFVKYFAFFFSALNSGVYFIRTGQFHSPRGQRRWRLPSHFMRGNRPGR